MGPAEGRNRLIGINQQQSYVTDENFPPLIKEDRSYATTISQKAELLADFSEKWLFTMSSTQNMNCLRKQTLNLMILKIKINKADVMNILQKVVRQKAKGLEKISPYMLSMYAPELIGPLTKLFQNWMFQMNRA